MDATPLTLLLWVWAFAALGMAVLWVVQRVTGDAGIADVGWAMALALTAVLFALLGDGDLHRRILLAVLAGGWGLRLALYILWDRVLRGGEDGRYRRMRGHWGPRAQPYFFLFFQAQAIFVVVFATPFLAVSLTSRPGLDLWDWLGALIWGVALLGESVADWQLARFRANPANHGRVCGEGLWRVSRHPNYFFEWVHWWAYVPMALGGAWGWLALLGPAAMLLFLFRVTGIPHTERQALVTRGEAYRAYQRRTSVFIPWFPRGGCPSAKCDGM